MPNTLSIADTRSLIRLVHNLHDLRREPAAAWKLLTQSLVHMTGARCAAIGERSGKPGSAAEPWDVRGKHGFLSHGETAAFVQAKSQPGFVWEATERMLRLPEGLATRTRAELLPPGDHTISPAYLELLDELDWGDMLISRREAAGERIAWLCLMKPADGMPFGERERTLVTIAHGWIAGGRLAWMHDPDPMVQKSAD
ncbi:MAG: hypothetical protein K2Q20_12555 [Phycisphaerales bacterium]|nr:hypothetical protein [Phycisphaerales bacterium]